ncbi:MAG: O-methyltransferase family 3 [Conexibacter sp.]|jgi:predicted O-methyltransferase YrrM|nr:O-methyltransferase family 3 [Conexibacter sp.]
MIVRDSVRTYLDATRPQPDVLLAEMEAHGARDRVPILDPHSGALLHVVARAMGARRIVEVGTAIGVSTLHLARALPDDGELISFELDRERHAAALSYLTRARLRARLDLRLQDAHEGLPQVEGPVDLVFLDGIATQYDAMLEQVVPLLRPGGVLVVDNVLVDDPIANERAGVARGEERSAAGLDLNARLLEHPELVTTLVPVGEGLAVAARR